MAKSECNESKFKVALPPTLWVRKKRVKCIEKMEAKEHPRYAQTQSELNLALNSAQLTRSAEDRRIPLPFSGHQWLKMRLDYQLLTAQVSI